ncbi:tetratricopeptide repeat protein [Nocardioides daejeonensis]|uniref:tetratricopeptide repeat protein n=1 Tax=Nocardioides daejeonensis TaxID=1046556 RepID=UPI000D74898D|nr:tetratricopeptide repeat protein [Nocardioides daejeonensis]
MSARCARLPFVALAALALLLPVLATLSLSTPAHAAASVKLAVSGSPVAGQKTKLTATVKPKAKGRSVVFSVKAGKKWKSLGKSKTNKGGVATLSTTKLKAGTQTIRAVAKKHKGNKERTATKKIKVAAASQTSGKAATLGAPSTVGTGSVFEFTVEISKIVDGVLTLTAPAKGRQVRRAGDVEVRGGVARVALGDVPASQPRTVTVRWQAPSSATTLQIRADLTGNGVRDRLSTTVQVVKGSVDHLPALDHSVNIMAGGGDLPQDGEDLIVLCINGPSRPIPSYAEALKQIDAWVETQFLPNTKSLWKNAPELTTSSGAHRVFAQAYLDDRPAAMMAAAIAGRRIAPTDARHLTNAAMTASMINRPDWAVALAQKAAGLPANNSGGVAQEAVRLNNLGHAWSKLGNFAKAEASLRAAIRLQPENPLLHRELGAILSCAGRPAQALDQMHEGYRESTAPDEVVVRDSYTQVDPERAFDMSQAVAGELSLFDVPGNMEKLIGLEGRNGAVGVDEDALNAQNLALHNRRLQLEDQLRERNKTLHPAEVERTQKILGRMNQTASKRVLELYQELRDAWSEQDVCGLPAFSGHPWCNVSDPKVSCGEHRQIASTWLQKTSALRQAIIAYHEVAWPTWTGLQGNLRDPIAHELAGVRMEQEMNFWAGVITNDLRDAAERFKGFNSYATGLTPGATCTNPEPLPPNATTVSKVEGEAPPLCSDAMKPWALEAKLLIATMKVSCERVSFELSTPPILLSAFAKVDFDFNPQGWVKSSRLTAGVKGGVDVPGAGFTGEAAFYLEQDTSGKLTDVGFTSGTELEIGHTIKLAADEAKSKWSFMSATHVY